MAGNWHFGMTAERARMAPYWTLAKHLRKYTNRLLRDWELPPDTTPLRLMLTPPVGEMSMSRNALADTIIDLHRDFWHKDGKTVWEKDTNMPGGWNLKIGWRLFMKRLDDYEDPFAVGEECVKHELAHILHAPHRALTAISHGGKYDSHDHATKVLTAWKRQRDTILDEYSDHGPGWKRLCERVGCMSSASIDNTRYLLTAEARRRYGLPDPAPAREPVKGFSLAHAAILDGNTPDDDKALTTFDWRNPTIGAPIIVNMPLWKDTGA